jgi:hypothetical protein
MRREGGDGLQPGDARCSRNGACSGEAWRYPNSTARQAAIAAQAGGQRCHAAAALQQMAQGVADRGIAHPPDLISHGACQDDSAAASV